MSRTHALRDRSERAHRRGVVPQLRHPVPHSAREGDVVAAILIEHAADQFLPGGPGRWPSGWVSPVNRRGSDRRVDWSPSTVALAR